MLINMSYIILFDVKKEIKILIFVFDFFSDVFKNIIIYYLWKN